jgi:hypothetical protein
VAGLLAPKGKCPATVPWFGTFLGMSFRERLELVLNEVARSLE